MAKKKDSAINSHGKNNFKEMNADLNIVLSKEQIDVVLKKVLGPKGERIGEIALATDYCCVDASVGSSVLGPVSSVASSVSVPGGEQMAIADKVEMDAKVVKKIKTRIDVPGDIQIK